ATRIAARAKLQHAVPLWMSLGCLTPGGSPAQGGPRQQSAGGGEEHSPANVRGLCLSMLVFLAHDGSRPSPPPGSRAAQAGSQTPWSDVQTRSAYESRHLRHGVEVYDYPGTGGPPRCTAHQMRQG